MKQVLNITYCKPEKQGVFATENGYFFAAEILSEKESGIILYDRKQKQLRIPFSKEGKRGSLYGVKIEGECSDFISYNYYEGDRIFTDPFAKGISGLEKWGDFKDKPRVTYGLFPPSYFEWEKDEPLQIPYEDTIIYGLNVRSFTMHKSSGVKNKGTFEGIIEKIPYLTRLGITAIELLPAYEYEECMYPDKAGNQTMEEAVKNCNTSVKDEKRLNCWGFQKGFYFAPKASYSMERPDISFKKMVKALHRNGIEVMMQFYFPPKLQQSYILEILKYWVIEYHIDGVHLNGFNIPYAMIANEPVLKATKIRSVYLPVDEIYQDEVPIYRNLATDNGSFRNDMKRFLKGDENLMNQVLSYQKNNPASYGVINYLADYDGFSLFDCVSYERKHNEANGENNKDGSDCNYSWNCGIEGKTRKKAISDLRLKQIKNGLSFLFLSQGVPYLFSGDEFANTRFGNNNAYSQDNETGWIKWKTNCFSDEVFCFTCFLIDLRKKHPVLHMKKECKVMDYIACGYPDISYHGTEAWRPDTTYISRMVGIMLCGKYVPKEKDDSFYIAYNMHWESHELALPKLPKGEKWVKVMSTSSEKTEETLLSEENKILAEGRSVSLYCSQKDEAFYRKEQVKKARRRIVKKNEGLETF